MAVVVGGHAAELLVIDQFSKRGVFAANGAVGIFAQVHLVKLHIQGIVQQQTADHRFAHAQNQLHRFGCLDSANRAGQNAEYPALGAAGHQPGRRWFWEEAAIARPFLGVKDRRLPLKTEDAAVNVRFAQQHTGIVGQVARGEIVRAVDNDVVWLEQFQRIIGRQRHFVGVYLDVWVDVQNTVAGAVQLRPPHVLGTMNDLPLQIGVIHHVVIHQPNTADSCRRQIHS